MGFKMGVEDKNWSNSLTASAEETVWREDGFHSLLMTRALQLVCSFGSGQWQAVWGSGSDGTNTRMWK